jgi:hypothetical protein
MPRGAVLRTSVFAQKKVAFVYNLGMDRPAIRQKLIPIHIGLAAAFTVTDHGYASGVEANYDSLATYDLVVLSEAMSGNTTLTNNLVKIGRKGTHFEYESLQLHQRPLGLGYTYKSECQDHFRHD